MDIYRLSKDELAYELQVRGVPGEATVAQMRQKLATVLRLEEQGKFVMRSPLRIDTGEELSTIRTKIVALSGLLEESNLNPGKAKKIDTSLTHLLGRVTRIETDDRELGRQRAKCLDDLLVLVNRLQISTDETIMGGGDRAALGPIPEQEEPLGAVEPTTLEDTPHPQVTVGATAISSPNSGRLNHRPSISRPEEVRESTTPHLPSRLRDEGAHPQWRPLPSTPRPIIDLDDPYDGPYTRGFGPAVRAPGPDPYGSRITATTQARHQQQGAPSPHAFQPSSEYPAHYSMHGHPLDYNDLCERRRSIPVKDWGITFSGDGNGLSLHSFLNDVEHYRLARRATYAYLHESAIDFFRGVALIWYKTIQTEVSSWGELVERLKEEYEEPNYEKELMKEIQARTQGVDERFGTYFMVMKTYFNRLPCPLTEEKKIDIVFNNMSPYFLDRLRGQRFGTLDGLGRAGREIQHSRDQIQRFQPPPTPKKTMFEPSLAYHPQRGAGQAYALGDPHFETDTTVQPKSGQTASSSTGSQDRRKCPSNPSSQDRQDLGRQQPSGSHLDATSAASTRQGPGTHGSPRNLAQRHCWNCKEPGHFFQHCPRLQLQFCIRCGGSLAGGACGRCPSVPLNARRGRK